MRGRSGTGAASNNLFDKEYYLRLGSVTSGNRYGEPRNTMVTLRGMF